MIVSDRYLSHVDERTPGECWPWTAATNKDGYGVFWAGEYYPGGTPKMVKAHRYGWKLRNGTDPGLAKVRHTCDDPPCQNPGHWLLGTQAQNLADMVERGRSVRGERKPNAKVTEALVLEIRRRHADEDITHQALADELGLRREHVTKILARRSWAHVGAHQ